MEVNQKILEIVRTKGPVLPVQVSREINDSLLLTSARLSELLSAKEIRVSNVKVGGSPLYYYNGQESKLQDFSNYLKDKEKEAYHLLKDQAVLSDHEQEPAIRVALRNIKDFAVPLEVLFDNNKRIFWKWYLLPQDQLQDRIKQKLTKSKGTIKEKLVENNKVTKEKSQPELAVEKSEPKQTTLKKPTKNQPKTTTSFIDNTNTYFTKNNIAILEEKEIKKGSEYNYVVELDSSIGKIQYFCKSRSKKKINDGDISSALVQAQAKNLPLLFISNGTLTKKTSEQLNKEFRNVIFKTI